MTDVSAALGTDFVGIAAQFGEQERDYLARTRAYVEDEVLPVINDFWERAEFPYELVRRMGELGLVSDGIDYPGVPAMSAASAGLVAMELSRGDGSLATFAGVQAGLTMRSIDYFGTEEQKARWLPALARCEALGAFALTEPDHGSDSLLLETSAVLDGDSFVLQAPSGGSGTAASPTSRWSGRAVRTARSAATWSRRAHPGTRRRSLPESCRSGPSGRPTSCPRTCASPLRTGFRGHAASRTPARRWLGPGASAPSARSVTRSPRKARQVCLEARDMMGGNGILLENHVIRHLADVEAIHTYEGTGTIQTLLVGQDITGVGAFA